MSETSTQHPAHVLRELSFFEDSEPRPAAFQMAMDQALLETSGAPVLRVYKWDSPCVTLGYFESQSAAKTAHPGLPLIRRWTGGGVVVHGQDTPYSLIVPQDEPFARVRPAVAYSLLHGALAEALRSRIPGVTLATECTPGRGADCFDNPVPADLLWQGRKIGGAGQRRTRFGLLHQGTLQAGRDLFAEVRLFAKKLTDRVEKYALTKQTLALAERHFETRYNLDSWNGDKRGS